MIWKQRWSIEDLDKVHQKTLVANLGIKIIEIGSDYIKAEMPIDERTIQPAGILHGGASVALSETMGSMASLMLIDFQTYSPVGIEVNANHIKQGTGRKVIGIAKPIKIGKRLHIWNTDIYNEQDELICTSRLTVMIIEKRK